MASKKWLLLVRAVITGPVNLLWSERREEGENRSPGSFLSPPGGKGPLGRFLHQASMPSDVLLITLHSRLPFYIPVLSLPGFDLHTHPRPSRLIPSSRSEQTSPVSAGGVGGGGGVWGGVAATDNVSRGRL